MATIDTATSTTETEPVSTTKVIEETVQMNGDKKEEESTSTEQTVDETEVTSNTNSDDHQNEQILLEKGTKLLEEENYNEAVSLLSNALEIIQQKDIATNIESVQYYMAYGESLLRLVQSCNDIFAAPVREVQQQHLEQQQNDEDVDQEEAPQLITDATEPTSAEINGDKAEDTKEQKVENLKEEQESDEDDDLPQPQEQPQAAVGDVDTSEDREIAWETFEYARSIIEEFMNKPENSKNDKYLVLLAKCHSFLGELLIEDENNEMALTEFEKALEIQDKCDKVKCRQRAFNHFMACLAAQFCEKDESALNHCNIALKKLSERICGILKEMECTEEMKEDEDYQNIIQIAETFVDGKDEESEQIKELKDLLGVMQDLMAKLDEVEQVIKVKKERPAMPNGGVNGDLGGLMNGEDALQSMIMSLTSQFGIDEEALNAMEDENKNKENVDDRNRNVGVTTIGFGNVEEVDGDEEVNDLGSFGKKKEEKKEVKKAGKKRSMEDADIDNDDEMNGNAIKKMKLNSGDAANVENVENAVEEKK